MQKKSLLPNFSLDSLHCLGNYRNETQRKIFLDELDHLRICRRTLSMEIDTL